MSIHKKWNLDRFIKEVIHTDREDINQQVKDMKDDYWISKVRHQLQSHLRDGKKSDGKERDGKESR